MAAAVRVTVAPRVERTLCGWVTNAGALAGAMTVRARGVAAEPAALVAVTVMALRPGAAGVPVIAPVAGSMARPAGRPEAE